MAERKKKKKIDRKNENGRICRSNLCFLCLMVYSYLPTPPHGQDMTQGQFFKRSLTVF